MQFKGVALQEEFRSEEVNPHLRMACRMIDGYFGEILKKKMIITSVLRQPEAQVDSCKRWKYKSKFEHCAGEAVDIRSRNLTEEEIKEVLLVGAYLGWLCRFEYHKKGTGPHFHLTIIGEKRRQDKICKIVEITKGASACFAG